MSKRSQGFWVSVLLGMLLAAGLLQIAVKEILGGPTPSRASVSVPPSPSTSAPEPTPVEPQVHREAPVEPLEDLAEVVRCGGPASLLLIPPPFKHASVRVEVPCGSIVALLPDPNYDPSPKGSVRVRVRSGPRECLEGWISRSRVKELAAGSVNTKLAECMF